jgi:prepilin-type N-terminal cleavage/methylation domain-containing protein
MMEIQKMVSEKSNFGFRISPAWKKRSGEGRDFGFLTPHSAFRIPQSKGFTLIEVIIVMVIIGILAATVVPRIDFTISTTASVDGAGYIIASDIRYTQECAMANRVSKSISFTSGQNSYIFPATVPATNSLDPSGQLPEGVRIGTTILFTFNSLGEPIANGGMSVTVRDLGSTQTRTITVLQYTGKVNISNP